MRVRPTLAGTAMIAAAVVAPLSVAFAAPNLTTGDLKRLCETSPGNVVLLPEGAKIERGAGKSAPELVTTGCTVNLPFDATLELVDVGMRFAGPLAVNATGSKAQLKLARAILQAPTVTADLRQAETELQMQDGVLRATTGDVSVRMAAIGDVQMQQNTNGEASLDAQGSVRVSGGEKLLLEVNSALVKGRNAISLSFDGPDGLLKGERARFEANGGGIAMTGAAPKTLLELKESFLGTTGGIDVRLAGRESILKGVLTQFTGVGVTTISMSPNAPNGLVELSDSLVQGRRVVVEASPGSEKGVVKFGKGSGQAGATAPSADSDLVFRTGVLGTTEVVESTLFAHQAVRITTGAQGSCKQEKNTITAALQQLC